jgi:hypothetical protein
MNNSHLCIQITQGENKLLTSWLGNTEGNGTEESMTDTPDRVESVLILFRKDKKEKYEGFVPPPRNIYPPP